MCKCYFKKIVLTVGQALVHALVFHFLSLKISIEHVKEIEFLSGSFSVLKETRRKKN